MVEIPESHPRYESLKTRESLVERVEEGITSKAGLIAHGRGEMFDYLLGERTIDSAKKAEKKAIDVILKAENPVISINGNVAALVPAEIVSLSQRLKAKLEVNLFHRSEERINKIAELLKKDGAKKIYGTGKPDAEIPGLEHERALCSKEGIYSADVVLVPLEDGDRAKALKEMGKTVITIDLNPISRTAKTADISIIDNIVRAVPNMIDLEPLSGKEFDNSENLSQTLDHMCERLKELSKDI
ncbi:MAG: phosphopantothenate/pantothenate synthetase [Candidatus Thermoplasmatota archaeon]|nr:phosphopantothenate/pantothenate synthetase [Candidatus Thermoplasmatota archaeon]